jgi:hypothetical protein
LVLDVEVKSSVRVLPLLLPLTEWAGAATMRPTEKMFELLFRAVK